jgi:hypothetical protein
MTTGSVPTKQDFDWLRADMLGFIRTQLIAAAATLRLPEQLKNGASGRPTSPPPTALSQQQRSASCGPVRRSAWSRATMVVSSGLPLAYAPCTARHLAISA